MLLELLAIIAARAVDAVVPENGQPHPHADRIARAVSLDMANYFTPSAGNFFARVSGAGIQAAISEARDAEPAPGWARMKKAELAALAEREIAKTDWLPEPLRIAEYGHAIDDNAYGDRSDGIDAGPESGDDPSADADTLTQAAE